MANAPLIILGLDAAEPHLLNTWAAAGHLPTLAGLMQRGRWGLTGGPETVIEHGVWLSLLTGVSRSRHGLFYLRQPDPGTYHLRVLTGRSLGVPPFWAALGGTGRRVAVVDVPEMPLVPGLPGLQLADWAVHYTEEQPLAEPAGLLAEATRVFGPREIVGEAFNSNLATDRALFERLRARVGRKGALLRHLLGQGDFDLIFAVFSEVHTAGHQLWDYTPEVTPGAPAGPLAGALLALYQAVDAEVGRLLAQLPAEANVLIVSTVGLKPQYPTGGLGQALTRQLGYQPAPSGGRPVRSPLDLARRLLPEDLRARLSSGLSRARREALLAAQFVAGTDWGRTTAYALPSNFTTLLRVNLRGREPAGTVEPGAGYEAVLAQLEADLAALVDPVTGRPAVLKVERTTTLFGGGPPERLPDLFVEWQTARHFMERVAHPQGDLHQRRPDFYRSTDHHRTGIIVAAGPDIVGQGPLVDDLDLLDLAPTALALLGQPAPAALTGQVASFVRGRA